MTWRRDQAKAGLSAQAPGADRAAEGGPAVPAASPEDQPIAWECGPRGDVPVSRRFADPFYARTDGLAEARHVFLGGNDLAARWRVLAPGESFALAELGFGTGLNCLAAVDLWQDVAPADASLEITSFEIAPLPASDCARALAAFPELDALAAAFPPDWQAALDAPRHGSAEDPAGWTALRLSVGPATLTVVLGDARKTLPRWRGAADAWFLDGFAPARNPEMWEPKLLAAMAGHTRPGGTAASYSAAGHVRRALAAAGFAVTKRPGFGAKRDMSVARLVTP